ncbi:NAD(P)-binding protein [Jackrogersella minutella]|nr:NAD(P)-binding protein [Jackrogersella minutella]
MVKIAIAPASSLLAREVIDVLVATGKHEIIGLIRRDPASFPSLPGVKWVQTTYEDKSELVRLFEGVETVLTFFPVHFDPGNVTQKRLIDAAVEAGVKRFAPSEWATGVKLESSTDVIPWYAGKIEISHYLEELNREKQVIEYTRFQVGGFMNYLAHPHKTSTHVNTLPFQFDFSTQHATVIEDSLDDAMTWITVEDIAAVVAKAIEYRGKWPSVGGMVGSRVTIREMLHLGEAVGRPFTIDWLKKKDLEAATYEPDFFSTFDLRAASQEELAAFLGKATTGILQGIHRGAYDVTDEWNKIFPDYKFTQVEDFVKNAWGQK